MEDDQRYRIVTVEPESDGLEPTEDLTERAKKFWKAKKHKLIPLGAFAKNCFASAAEMREKANVMDFANLAFQVKDHFQQTLGKSDTNNIFKDWKKFCFEPLSTFIVDSLLKINAVEQILLAQDDSSAAYQVNYEDGILGWRESLAVGGCGISLFYNPDSNLEKLQNLIREIFWATYQGKAVMTMGAYGEELTCSIDASEINLVRTARGQKLIEEIKKFQECGYSRSILFHGPPGTGKSNLVADIAQGLGDRVLKFEQIWECSDNQVAEIIALFKPSSVLFEDVDHLEEDELSLMLAKFEQFNKQKVVLLATANYMENLDEALIRPGRFDQTIEISSLEPEVILELVGQDQEIFEIVRDFPVAFINETIKRIKVLGKDNLDISDLLERLGMEWSEKKKSLSKEKDLPEIPTSIMKAIVDFRNSQKERPRCNSI